MVKYLIAAFLCVVFTAVAVPEAKACFLGKAVMSPFRAANCSGRVKARKERRKEARSKRASCSG